MADDVETPYGSIAADEVAGKKIQRVKVQHGPDGSAVDASGANPFPVGVISELPAGSARIGKVGLRNAADSADIDALSEGTFTARIGATSDAEATADGPVIGILKRIRTLLEPLWTALGVAHDDVDAGNPLSIGGQAASGLPTAVEAGDRVRAYFDTQGRLHVVVDAGGGSGGQQYAEDAVHVTADLGNAALVVRKDSPAGLSSADGKYSLLTVDALNQLYAKSKIWDGTDELAVNAAGAGSFEMYNKLDPTNDVVALGSRVDGGPTPFRLTSAATINATTVKASAGQLYWFWFTNVAASTRYLKLYNKASNPVPSTDAALLVAVFPLQAGKSGVVPLPWGMPFSTGVAFVLTTGASDTDETALSAGEVFLAGGYK